MDQGLEYYKDFIDGLVERKWCAVAQWVREGCYRPAEYNQSINSFLASLTPGQRELLARLLEDAKIGGIHDTLAYMNEMMDLDGLELRRNGVTLPHDEFASLHYDFIARADGVEWPE